jgi:hypothetical protein
MSTDAAGRGYVPDGRQFQGRNEFGVCWCPVRVREREPDGGVGFIVDRRPRRADLHWFSGEA